ncbi:MAG: hypothetical protein ACT4QG_16335 [Sporichthyaceae bacterium]
MVGRGAIGVVIVAAVLAGCGGGSGVVAAESGGSETGSPAGSGSSSTPTPGGEPGNIPGLSGSQPGTVAPATPSSTPSPVDLDEGTEAPAGAPAGKARPGTPADAEVVKPRAGMDNTHTVTWDRADVVSSKVIRVYFYGGVAPCSVLDSVKVEESADSVRITLRSGSDPAKPDAMCIQIAKYKAVDVTLSEPVGDRAIVDGSAEDAQD